MGELDVKARNRLLGVLFSGVLMGALDIAIVGPALPALQRAFGVDERALAWVFAIYVLMNLISTPLMAKLSDRFGRRSIYVLDVAIFAIGSLIVAFSPSFALLLFGRAVQGFGSGGIFPVASAVVGDTFPPEKRGTALGLIGAVFGVAFLLGPILGGVLLMLGWQWLFLVNLPLAAIIIVLSLRIIPATRPAQPRPFDWPGMITIGVLLASLAYGITEIDVNNLQASLLSLQVWPFLLIAVVLFPVLLMVERKALDPVIRLNLFRSRQVGLICGVAFGAGMSEAVVVFVPALLVAAFHVTTATASFMLIPIVLAMAIGSPFSGWLLDRSGARVVIVLGCAFVSLGLGLSGLITPTVLLFYTAAALFGFGLSILLGAALRYVMLNETRPEERASAQGLLTIFTSVGQLIGSMVVGAVVSAYGNAVAGYAAAFLLVAGIMLLLMFGALGLKSHADELATARERSEGLAQTARAS